MKKGAHGKKLGALRAPGSTQLPHNVLYYKHYLQLFNTEKVFSPWQPIWKRCEDRNDSSISQKRPYFLHTKSIWPIFPFLSIADNVHFYVFWCLLARSKTQYQSFCNWMVWGQNRTKRCKSYFVLHIIPENYILVWIWPWIYFQEVNVSPESLKYIWYPELEIYGLERFGRQRVLKEMSGVRIRRNRTIHYELG